MSMMFSIHKYNIDNFYVTRSMTKILKYFTLVTSKRVEENKELRIFHVRSHLQTFTYTHDMHKMFFFQCTVSLSFYEDPVLALIRNMLSQEKNYI